MTPLEKILGDLAQEKTRQVAAKTPPAVVRRKDVMANPFAGTITPTKPAEPGGWRGFVGDVMGSPVGKVLTGAGEVLALPGRTVTSGLKELVDVLDTDPNTAASWDDFKTQVRDPNFGFGTITKDLTGNKWVDRAIGFVGDVALDPLTYVTLGTSKFSGVGGRFALANLAKKTLPEISGAKLAKIIRYGRSALDADEIARLGVNRSGLYMFGKFIPGTGKVGGKIEDVLSHARVWTSDTRLGRAMQKSFTPGDFKDFRLMLQRDEVPDSRVKEILTTVMSRDSQRASKASAAIEGQRRVVASATADEAEFETVRGTLYKLLEDDAAAASASEVERNAHARWRGTLNSFRDDIEGVYKTIQGAEDTTIGFRENYFPRIETDAATEWRLNSKSEYASKASELTEDPLATVGVFNPRKLKKGSEWFGHVLEETDLNIDRLNELANIGGFKGQYFETDLGTVMNKYVNDYAEQMGIAARYKDIADNGVLRELTEKGVDEVVVDPAAVKRQTDKVNNVRKELQESKAALANSASEVLEQTVAERGRVAGELQGVLGDVESAKLAADAAEQSMNRLRDGLDSSQNRLNSFRETFEGLMGGRVPAAAQPVIDQIDSMSKLLDEMKADAARAVDEEQAFKLEYEAAQSDRAAVAERQKAARQQRAENLRVKKEKYDASADAISNTIKYNGLITDNWDLIKSGDTIVGPDSETLNSAAAWIGAQPLSPVRRGMGVRLNPAPGNLQSYIKTQMTGREWFKRLNSKIPVKKTNVVNRSDKTFIGTVAGLIDSGIDYVADARVDGMWAIARDERIYGDDAPRLLQGQVREELEEVLAEAESVVARGKAAEISKESEQALREEARFYDDLVTIEPELRKAGQILQSFTNLTNDLEVRGLSKSTDVVTEQDRVAFVQMVIGEIQDTGETIASRTVPDVADEPLSVVGLEETGFARRTNESVVRSQQEASDYLTKLRKVTEKPVKTYEELYKRINEVKKLIAGRKFEYGSGAAKRTLTPGDALVRANAANGKSVLDNTLESANQRLSIRGELTSELDAEEVSFRVAEKMTNYYLTSEIHTRFYNLVSVLSSKGIVPSKQMLDELAANITAPFIDAWSARVARLAGSGSPQLDSANEVLARLKSFASGPDEDFYSSLLGDAGQRLQNAAPPTRARRNVPMSKKSEQILDAATDSAQSAKADPTYLKSMHDKEIVDALEDLSGVDLHRHTLADGTKGFLTTDAAGNVDILKLPDGKPLSFTESEWESLFVPPGKTSDADKAALGTLNKQIDEVTKKRNALSKEAEILDKRRLEGTATSSEMGRLNKLLRNISALNEQAADLLKQAKPLRLAVETQDPAVRSLALEKARILVHGNGQQKGWYAKGTPVDDIRTSDARRATARRKNIHDSWRSTEEGALDAKIASDAARANLKSQAAMMNDPEALGNHADRLIESANEAALRASDNAATDTAQETVSLASKVTEARDRYRAAQKRTRAATSQATRLEKQINALRASLETTLDKEVAKALKGMSKELDDSSAIKATLTEAESAYNTAKAFYASKQAVADEVIPALETKLNLIDNIINGTVDMPQARVRGRFAGKPPQTAAPVEQVGKAKKRATARGAAEAKGQAFQPKIPADQAAELIRWSRSARRAIQAFGADPDDPIARALLAEAQAESRFLLADVSYKQEQNILAQLKKGDVFEKIARAADNGWTSMERANLPRMQMPKDLADAMANVRRAQQPEVARVLNKFLGRYTQFFKAYATLSPGFHVRNAIGNTIMVFAAGADPRNMVNGLEIYSSLRKAIKEQVPFETWLEGVAKNVSPEELERIRIAVRAAEAAGGGRIEEAFADFFKKGQKLSDNKLTQTSRRVGERVEGSARFMLAYDSVAKGMDFNGATARVRRYLFDYNDVGTADMALRQIIPFWMWMSRNLPLQIVNQWTEPRTYAIYNQFLKNFGEEDDGEVVPKWLKDQGAVKLTDNWYLSFDIGTSRVKEQFEMLKQPTRFLKDVNPILRVPFEVGMLNKKLYRGVPFSEEPVQVAGGPLSPAVLALAKMLGQTEQLPGGGTGVSDKFNYMLMNLNPLAGTLERTLPSSEFYQERQLGSVASFLGLPVRQVTEGAREAELRRRKFEGE